MQATPRHRKPLDYLDEIPEKLYQCVITHRYRRRITDSPSNVPQCNLQQRCLSVLKIRRFLLTPAALLTPQHIEAWLEEALAEVVCRQLNESKLLATTRSQPDVADEVIIEILNGLNQIYISGQLTGNESMMAFERELDCSFVDAQRTNRQSLIESEAMQALNRRFQIQRHLGWDLSTGIESAMDVSQLLKTHEAVKSSKQLQSVIRLLGRCQPTKIKQTRDAGFSYSASDGVKNYDTLPDEYTINSVTGVCYGDDLCRMLPSELALLGHPILKKLWHARRAESQLLNYHFRGVLSTHLPEFKKQGSSLSKRASTSVKANGPVILCVDTSASMKGKPERLAKAIALECMRVAYIEKRNCYLYCFSGPQQIKTFELNLNHGWKVVIEFLRLSFNGGTDINSVLLQASEKLAHNDWAFADVLLVSDGRFQINDSVVSAFAALNANVRILGAQVSNWSSARFSVLCHPTFRLNNAID